MFVTNLKLQRIGSQPVFAIPDEYVKEEDINKFFNLLFKPSEENEQIERIETDQRVKEIILERLKANNGKTFFNDFAVAVSNELDVPLPDAKELVESTLPKIPTVQNTGDGWYVMT